MTQKVDRTRMVLQILINAWILSIVPLMLSFVYSAPGFPDVAPTSSPWFYACVGIFAGLQIAIAITGVVRRNSVIALIAAICFSVLILYPELFVFFFLLLLWPFVAATAAIVGSIRMLRLVKQLKQKQ